MNINKIELVIREDEFNWYFEIKNQEYVIEREKINTIIKYITYVKNVKSKIIDKKIIIEIKKVR